MFDRIKLKTFKAIEKLYLIHDFTAREICELYGVAFESRYNKLFYTVFGSKGKGHGGSRKGAGNNL